MEEFPHHRFRSPHIDPVLPPGKMPGLYEFGQTAHGGEDWTNLLQKFLSRGVQHQMNALSVKQRKIQLPFQPQNGFADRGLGHHGFRCRLGCGAVFRYQNEVLHLRQIHREASFAGIESMLILP